MLPSGKFFRKNIAFSPNFVYTGKYIGHSSLRRKQVSSPPVQPHPAASRRGRQNCLPRLFCCFSILPVFVFSALALLRIFALPALLSFRYLHFRHCCRTGFCTSPASLIGPIFPRFRLCHRHGSRLSRRCYHLGSCFFLVPIICRYFLFSGIDSSPVPGSFFSAGVPFLDLREGCFYPFGFLRCRFFGLHPPVLSSYCPIF